MNDNLLYEKEIRDYLKGMTDEQLYDSGLLFLNLDSTPIDKIIDNIISLYIEYLDLSEMVKNNFKSSDPDAPKVLRPNDYDSQRAVILNCSRKLSVLNFILNNEKILSEFKHKLSSVDKKK